MACVLAVRARAAVNRISPDAARGFRGVGEGSWSAPVICGDEERILERFHRPAGMELRRAWNPADPAVGHLA
jgi:hypothetical protein